MSTDKHPTLYVIAHGGRWVMASCASTTRSFVEADLRRLLSKEPAFPGNPEVVPYVPASVLDALRAENERLRTTIDGATVIGATTAKTCGRGEPPCKRTPGHADDCMGLHGEALAADLSDARAEVEALRKERDAQIEIGANARFSQNDALAMRDEWKAKADAAVAHAAALEAAVRRVVEPTPEDDNWDAVLDDLRAALSGGTSALDAVRAADRERIAALEAAIESLRKEAQGAASAFKDLETERAFERFDERLRRMVIAAERSKRDGGTAALAAHDAARDAEVRKRVEGLERLSPYVELDGTAFMETDKAGDHLNRADVLDALAGE